MAAAVGAAVAVEAVSAMETDSGSAPAASGGAAPEPSSLLQRITGASSRKASLVCTALSFQAAHPGRPCKSNTVADVSACSALLLL